MTKLKEILATFHEHIIPIILGCIIFPTVYWFADNVDNPNMNPYVRGGTFNPIHKTSPNRNHKNTPSGRQNTRTPTGMSVNSIVFGL